MYSIIYIWYQWQCYRIIIFIILLFYGIAAATNESRDFFFLNAAYSFKCFIEVNESCDMHAKCGAAFASAKHDLVSDCYYLFCCRRQFSVQYWCLFTNSCCECDTISSIQNITPLSRSYQLNFILKWMPFDIYTFDYKR